MHPVYPSSVSMSTSILVMVDVHHFRATSLSFRIPSQQNRYMGRWIDWIGPSIVHQQCKMSGNMCESIFFLMMQCTYCNSIWWHRTHYRTETIDRNQDPSDSGVIGTYEKEDGQNQKYYRIIQNIIKIDFWRFDMFVFDIKWFKDVLGKVPQCSINIDGSGFTMIDSRGFVVPRRGPLSCHLIVNR
jgi:hypothetical protein